MLNKCREDIKTNVVKPYFEKHPEADKSTSIVDMLDFENIFGLKYYNYCFLESLRIEPPVVYSSLNCVSETVTVGGLTI